MLNASVAASFEQHRPYDIRRVEKLGVHFSSNDPVFTSVRHLQVSFYNKRGEDLASPQIFSAECKPEPDALDLAAYFQRGREIYLAVASRLRPVLAARTLLLAKDPIAENGIVWNLPGCYLPNGWQESGLDDLLVQDIVKNRLGLQARGASFNLGGPYFPSVGSSIEACFPRAIDVAPPDFHTKELFGSEFHGHSRLSFLSLQQVISGFLQGSIRDTRMVLAAFRLAARHGIELKVPFKLLSRGLGTPPLEDPAQLHSDLVERIEVAEAAAPQNSFIKLRSLQVQNLSRDNRVLDQYHADTVTRPGIDSVDIGCYSWHQGRIYLPLRKGVRPTLAFRTLMGLAPEISPLDPGGVAESLEGEGSIEEIAARAAQGVREELGLEPLSCPYYLGASYPSPGTNPERAYSFLVEVDPSLRSEASCALDERGGWAYAPIEDVIKQGEDGAITDLRYLVNAYIIQAAMRG
ncbi:MAG: hypothetical protein DCC75_10615 [Proteobacteria bacterium]|nr:MAG: hypothetical protein DCC75_10615 [Pseudomonadota bacterium]